ncbi:MAG: hypothetical protein M3245_03675, partial [Actinomycetota bacterium]|nr:hypothetical protein [Actinomycetota bacterium]
PDPVPAEMVLSDEALELSPADPADISLRIPRRRLGRVRRHLGTPVIVLRYEQGAEDREVLLYFAAPPPLADRGAGLIKRRLERTESAAGLASANRGLKPTVKAWARALAEAGRVR